MAPSLHPLQEARQKPGYNMFRSYVQGSMIAGHQLVDIIRSRQPRWCDVMVQGTVHQATLAQLNWLLDLLLVS